MVKNKGEAKWIAIIGPIDKRQAPLVVRLAAVASSVAAVFDHMPHQFNNNCNGELKFYCK